MGSAETDHSSTTPQSRGINENSYLLPVLGGITILYGLTVGMILFGGGIVQWRKATSISTPELAHIVIAALILLQIPGGAGLAIRQRWSRQYAQSLTFGTFALVLLTRAMWVVGIGVRGDVPPWNSIALYSLVVPIAVGLILNVRKIKASFV